jgi:hypothetical protein
LEDGRWKMEGRWGRSPRGHPFNLKLERIWDFWWLRVNPGRKELENILDIAGVLE